jgi:hypothetical protein
MGNPPIRRWKITVTQMSTRPELENILTAPVHFIF